MHELGITEGIIGRAREAARDAGGMRVTDVYLTITPAADFAPDSIEMYFEMLTDGDDYFRGARLHWETADGSRFVPAVRRHLSGVGAAAGLSSVPQSPGPLRPPCAHAAARWGGRG